MMVHVLFILPFFSIYPKLNKERSVEWLESAMNIGEVGRNLGSPPYATWRGRRKELNKVALMPDSKATDEKLSKISPLLNLQKAIQQKKKQRIRYEESFLTSPNVVDL